MKKVRKTYLKAATESLRNSRIWLEESIHFLYERESYGHSLSLSLFSLEEAIKSWICISVALGSLHHSDPQVREVFESHESKLGSALTWLYAFNVPLMYKSMFELISEDEQKTLLDWVNAVDETYRISVYRLVQLRMRGIYVDLKEGKMFSPQDISKEEAESMLYDVQNFVRLFEMILKKYHESTPEEKVKWAESAEKIAKVATENWRKIIDNQDEQSEF